MTLPGESSVARLLERLRGGGGATQPAAVERLLHERFRFLEERQGFELARSKRLDDGAVAAYANRPARRGLVVFAREGRGAWAGVGSLGEDGVLPPINRETVEQGLWRELRRVDLRSGRESLDEALTALARSLGATNV